MKTLEDFSRTCTGRNMPCSCEESSYPSSKTLAARIMARRRRTMVVLAFLTHASFELCGFAGSWRAKGEDTPMRPMTLGVKAAVDPAQVLGAASAATSLLDFLNRQLVYFTSTFLNIKPLRTGGEGSEHAKRLADAVDKARQEGNVIIPQGQLLPEQPVEGTGFQLLMITVLNDNRTGGLSAVHAEPGVGKSVATALALRNYTQKSAVSVLLQAPFPKNLRDLISD